MSVTIGRTGGSARMRTGLRLAAVVAGGLALASCSFLDWGFMGGGSKAPSPSVDPAPTRSVFSLPRMGFPGLGRGGRAGVMSASERQCRAALKRRGVQFTDLAPIRDSAACGIDHPVRVSTLARGVALSPAATLNCQAALAAAEWLQKDAAPAARKRYLTGIAEVNNMSSYSCRRIRGSSRWSEHSKGNALDIGSFTLKNGHVITVSRQSLLAMRARGFLHAARAGACDEFSTVLGPGSDADHADHFHFDLRHRSSGYRHCD
ncbi:MAG: extensin family protein [Roseitalea sp.]|nr:extensin family protein [Roseitalea sp.]MBO6722266.1 extensin family protein [Roseitalea sp.]MBO6742405.1 extensin family protein [Roseitalea sp.]